MNVKKKKNYSVYACVCMYMYIRVFWFPMTLTKTVLFFMPQPLHETEDSTCIILAL